MKRKVNYQAPFDRNGNLMHYPQTECVHVPGAVWTGNGWNPPSQWIQPDWREVVPFEAVLTLEDGISSGRSAKYLHWTDEQGHRYPMFVADLVKLVLSSAKIDKGRVSGWWVVCKRGQNYGIKFVEEET